MLNTIYLNEKYPVKVTYLQNDFNQLGKYIYALIFPDNSVYVGSCTQNLGDRIQNHTTHYMTNKTRKDKAIKKFREFNVSVLRECNSVEELKYYERKYIHSIANNITLFDLDKEYDNSLKDYVKYQLLNDVLL